MLDQLRKDLIAKTLDAHIPNCFDTVVAADGLAKRLLASDSFLAPIATFVRCETNTLMEKEYNVAYV